MTTPAALRPEPVDPETVFLAEVREAFDGQERAFSATIVQHLNREGGSWTQKLLSTRLARYGVTAELLRIGAQGPLRGYRRDNLTNTWETYLSAARKPPTQPPRRHPPHPQ